MFEAGEEAGSENTNSDEYNQTNSSVQPLQPQTIKCPQCGSTNTICSGKRYNKEDIIQRYLCKKCYYRFSDPKHQQTKLKINNRNMLQHAQKIHTLTLNSFSVLDEYCQWNNETLGGESTARKAAKTLATVNNQSKSGLTGATETFSENPAQVNDIKC